MRVVSEPDAGPAWLTSETIYATIYFYCLTVRPSPQTLLQRPVSQRQAPTPTYLSPSLLLSPLTPFYCFRVKRTTRCPSPSSQETRLVAHKQVHFSCSGTCCVILYASHRLWRAACDGLGRNGRLLSRKSLIILGFRLNTNFERWVTLSMPPVAQGTNVTPVTTRKGCAVPDLARPRNA